MDVVVEYFLKANLHFREELISSHQNCRFTLKVTMGLHFSWWRLQRSIERNNAQFWTEVLSRPLLLLHTVCFAVECWIDKAVPKLLNITWISNSKTLKIKVVYLSKYVILYRNFFYPTFMTFVLSIQNRVLVEIKILIQN